MNRTKPFALLAALLALALVCVSCSDDSDSTADGSQESSNTSLSLRSVIALPKADSVQLIWSSPSGTKSWGGVRISWGSGAVDVAKGTNTYTVTGLSLGTKYTFNVIPLDSSMSAAGSAKTVSVTTTAQGSGGTATSVISKTYAEAVTFSMTETEDGVSVEMESSTEGASIYYTVDNTEPSDASAAYSAAIEVTESTVLKAIAIKEGIEDSPVSVASIVIKERLDHTAPAKVSSLSVTALDSSVRLTWTDPDDEDLFGIEITYSDGSGRAAAVMEEGSVLIAPGTQTATISGLVNGTEYTFTVRAMDTTGNKSEAVTTGTVTPTAGSPLSIVLSASVPQENGYTGNKRNTTVTVTANITTASAVKKAVYKKDGTRVAADLLADTGAALLTVDENDNLKWTFTLTATDESLNGTTYTVAAIDVAGREETGQITLGDIFDFTAPASVTNLSSTYDSAAATITLTWTDPSDDDFDHVLISYITNDGTNDSAESEAVTVAKGTQAYTLSDVDGTVQYYRFTIKSVDELGNTSGGVSKRCWLNSTKVNAQIGDIVLSDGSLVTQSEYTSSLEAVAVVFREYDDVNDLPALAVGLVEGTDLAWAPSGTTGYTTNFTGIQGTVSSSTYTYGTTTYSGDDDGSDNWAYIQSVDASGTANAETYYPVFNWVNNYDTNAGISTTIDWYLPSFAELVLLKENISAIKESITTAGGTAFATGLWYWSSTQDSADRGNALELNILQDEQQCIIQKTFSSNMRIRAIMKLE